VLPGQRFRLASKARLREDAPTGKWALIGPETVLMLNPTAAATVLLCDGRHTYQELVTTLATRFGVDAETVDRDAHKLLAQLIERGFLETFEAATQDEQAHRDGKPIALSLSKGQGQGSAQAAPRPFGLLAELTHRCPLHCPYCSNPPTVSGAREELSTEDWRRVLDQAAELGVLHALFSGGEPLLRSDLAEICGAAHHAGLYTNLITSAYGMRPEVMERLCEAGLDSVQISFQGDQEAAADAMAGIAAHQRKLEAARLVRSLGLPLTVNVVLHRQNLDRIEQVIALAEGLGAQRLELANVQLYGWGFENRELLLPSRAQLDAAELVAKRAQERLRGQMEILYVRSDLYGDRPKPCMNGWGQRFLTVDPSGDVLPCPTSRAIQDLSFDNVRDFSLGDIWRGSAAFNHFRGQDWMLEPCRSCPEREKDFGGCRCQAALLTGNAAQTDPACSLAPERWRAVALTTAGSAALRLHPLKFRQNPVTLGTPPEQR